MKKLSLFISLLIYIPVYSQTSLGLEVQAYPAGIVPGLSFDLGISDQLNLTSRIGYNFTDRRDWGEHDNEEGGGPGFSLGLERNEFITENLSLQLRSDLWFMEIDWEDTRTICSFVGCSEVDLEGSSDIMVLQPTIGLTYDLPIFKKFTLSPSLSFGWEINVKTKGQDAGQGAIFLVGFELRSSLKLPSFKP